MNTNIVTQTSNRKGFFRKAFNLCLSVFPFCLLLLFSCAANAQQPDSLKALRSFLAVSNVSRQVPFYLHLQVHSTTNFITAQQDTAGFDAHFYLAKNAAYIKWDKMELVISDSLVLMISNAARRMRLYPAETSLQDAVMRYTGLQLTGASIDQLARKYKASENPQDTTLHLVSRNLLYGTALPTEETVLKYGKPDSLPQKAVFTKRSLVTVSASDYDNLKNDSSLSGRLVVIQNRHFILKETVATYEYKQVSYNTALAIPVSIGTRIQKDSDGKYVPVQGFEAFVLTQED